MLLLAAPPAVLAAHFSCSGAWQQLSLIEGVGVHTNKCPSACGGAPSGAKPLAEPVLEADRPIATALQQLEFDVWLRPLRAVLSEVPHRHCPRGHLV